MIPSSRPYISANAISYVTDVLRGDWLSPRGPYSKQFVQALERKFDARVTLTNSGTSALEVAIRSTGKLFARETGQIVVPAYTCPDCAVAIMKTGYTPVFADVCVNRHVITYDTLQAALKQCSQPVGVMLVSMWGMNPGIDTFKLARDMGLFIIADMAECMAAAPGGMDVLHMADASVTSFRGEKPLPIGTGGAVFTRHEGVAGVANAIVGMNSPGRFHRLFAFDVPWSYEFPELLAALGLAQLEEYDERIAERWRVIDIYKQAGFVSHFLDGDIPWKLPVVLPQGVSSLAAWELAHERGIEVSPPHVPLYKMPFLAGYRNGVLPISEWLYEHTVNFPILPNMAEEEIERVVEFHKEISVNFHQHKN